MKYVLIIGVLLLSPCFLYAQKAVKDDAVRAQERRQTHIKWGDWQPKAKKPWWSGGINVNPNHEMVWGWTAPAFGGSKSRNKNYQKTDIRPLRVGGTQTLRMAALAQQSSILDNSLKEVEILKDEALKEYASQSGLTSSVDPAWLFYFKKAFKPLTEFNIEAEYAKINDAEVKKLLIDGGFAQDHIDEMKNLQDRLKNAQDQMMPKGQRLLFYHSIFDDYRKEAKKFKDHIRTISLLMKNKRNNKYYEPKYLPEPNMGDWKNRDEQIATEIIARARVQ